jgi:hypothetical protein
MERAVLHRTYDSWKATNPDDESLGPEPSDEDELPPEPTVEEVYIGWPVSYCHRVRFASGSVYSVVQSTSGGFIGDYEIHGPGNFYRDGYEDPEEAINWLCDPERRDW